MTTVDELYLAIDAAVEVAFDVASAVRERADSLSCVFSPSTCEGQLWTAKQNLTTVQGLRERVDEALAAEPERAGDILAQALVVVEQTGQQTQRLAEWASESWLASLAGETWSTLVDLVADLAYELAGAVVVVGKAAAKTGLGWILGGAAAVIGTAVVLLRR